MSRHDPADRPADHSHDTLRRGSYREVLRTGEILREETIGGLRLVAGVLLGFAVPVLRSRASGGPAAGHGLAEEFEHRFRPIPAGFAVPVSAFFCAGVTVGGRDGLTSALSGPATLGSVAGPVLGKPIGVVGATWLPTKVTRSRLDPSFTWIDLVGVALPAGIGLTVSLLIAELSSTPGSLTGDHAEVAILTASVLAALLATLVLRARDRHHRDVEAEESVDADHDGTPDVDEDEGPERVGPVQVDPDREVHGNEHRWPAEPTRRPPPGRPGRGSFVCAGGGVSRRTA